MKSSSSNRSNRNRPPLNHGHGDRDSRSAAARLGSACRTRVPRRPSVQSKARSQSFPPASAARTSASSASAVTAASSSHSWRSVAHALALVLGRKARSRSNRRVPWCARRSATSRAYPPTRTAAWPRGSPPRRLGSSMFEAEPARPRCALCPSRWRTGTRWMSITVRFPSSKSPKGSLPYNGFVTHEVEGIILDLEGDTRPSGTSH